MDIQLFYVVHLCPQKQNAEFLMQSVSEAEIIAATQWAQNSGCIICDESFGNNGIDVKEIHDSRCWVTKVQET